MAYLSKILKNRFVIFALFMVAFAIVQYLFYGTYLPSAENRDLWFYSGIFMVLFSILFIEPYYTSPKNVITNAIPLLLVFLAIKSSFENYIFWWTAMIFLILLLGASVSALGFEDKDKSPNHWKNKTSARIKNIVVFFGQGRVLYSLFFLYFLLTYYSIQNLYTLVLFVLWFFILSINPKNIRSNFPLPPAKDNSNLVGEIFSVQSKKIFLAKLFEDKMNIGKFDIVDLLHKCAIIGKCDIKQSNI